MSTSFSTRKSQLPGGNIEAAATEWRTKFLTKEHGFTSQRIQRASFINSAALDTEKNTTTKNMDDLTKKSESYSTSSTSKSKSDEKQTDDMTVKKSKNSSTVPCNYKNNDKLPISNIDETTKVTIKKVEKFDGEVEKCDGAKVSSSICVGEKTFEEVEKTRNNSSSSSNLQQLSSSSSKSHDTGSTNMEKQTKQNICYDKSSVEHGRRTI